ncbi:MAG: hypothetical protein QXI91_00755 [Candidatus Bathyarchaeia archaeon]
MFPPELLILVGVNIFVFLSLLTSIFDEQFPKAVPYVFHIGALAGFGQIWVNYALLLSSVEARFWCSIFYLAVAQVVILLLNLHILIKRKMLNAAGVFLGSVTIPALFISFFLVSAYINKLEVWMPPFPIVPVEAIYIVLLTCIFILGISTITYFEPSTLKNKLRINRKQQENPKIIVGTPINDEDSLKLVSNPTIAAEPEPSYSSPKDATKRKRGRR